MEIVRAVRGGQDAVGYLRVTFGNAFLQQMLDHVAEGRGYTEIQQSADKEQSVALATRGDATLQDASVPLSAPVPGTQWKLMFWPVAENAVDNDGSVTPTTRLFWSIFASALLLMALFAFVFSKMVTRLVRNDLNTLMVIARQGKKNAEQRAVLYNFQSAMDALEKVMIRALASSIPHERSLVAKAAEPGIAPWDLDDVMQIFQKEKPLAALGNDKARQYRATKGRYDDSCFNSAGI